MESELTGLIEGLQLDIYRHDQNLGGGRDGSATLREGFLESDWWRHHAAFYAICDRIRARHPDLILQQASGGGTRLELATLAHWDENYTSDRVAYPYVYQMASGLSVYLPPETLVTPIGMAGNCRNQPDFVTQLRAVYASARPLSSLTGCCPRASTSLRRRPAIGVCTTRRSTRLSCGRSCPGAGCITMRRSARRRSGVGRLVHHGVHVA